ncbi:MAG: VOC family protein [Asticcacaulis sp.]|uniref:VOC family protein n=1 Tax=Asticcacaulis sp. TaxID=1872648 RepID=UPI0039E34C51
MAQVIGLGVFIKAKKPKALAKWYREVLGMNMDANWFGTAIPPQLAPKKTIQVFSLFKSNSDYMKPSKREFMLNFCVDDMDSMLARCAEHDVKPIWRNDEDPSGRFAHILDPEGTKIELWEPASV